MNDVPYVTISLSKKDKQTLENLCKKEHRGKSNMIAHMMKVYIEKHQK